MNHDYGFQVVSLEGKTLKESTSVNELKEQSRLRGY